MVRRYSSLRRCRAGLGGFLEAILAVMIVTSGFTILLVSINLAHSDESPNGNIVLSDQVREICQRLLGDERLFQSPYILILGNSFLWSEIVQSEMASFKEYSIKLTVDLEHSRSITLAEKGTFGTEEWVSLRIPVNVQLTPYTIRAGILEVRAGA